MEQMTIEKPKVGLNVTAKEFVPSKKPALSVNAPAFVPKGCSAPVNEYAALGHGYDVADQFAHLSVDVPSGRYEPVNCDIIERFQFVLSTLTMSPGNMEEYLKPLCETIEKTADSPAIAQSLCNMLLEHSISEENFRYTGARICQFLNNNLTSNKYVTGFAKLFVTRCGDEFSRRNELLQGSEEDKRNVCGLAIFMAEVFLNVQTTISGKPTRFEFMPEKLTVMVKTLLSAPDDMTVKCVCQLLKLVGGLLEDYVKVAPKLCEDFESIFEELKKLLDSGISQNIKSLTQSVIELKRKNWNRTTTSPPKKDKPSMPSEVTFQQEPVFYSNGRECSREESVLPEIDKSPYVLTDEEELAFFEWQAEQDGGAVQWNDPGYESYQFNDEFGSEPWMGDDLEAAYEEFLQGQSHSGQRGNDLSGFSRQVNPAGHHGVYQQHPNDTYAQVNSYNEVNTGLPYSRQYYEGGASEVNQRQYQQQQQSQQPQHPQQPRYPQAYQSQQPYDQSYPPNNYPPHR